MEKTASKKKSRHFSPKETELRLARSLFISFLGEDREGAYRPEFIQETLEAARERPTRAFTSPDAFLAQMRGV